MAKTFAVSGQHYLFDVQAFAHTILALGGDDYEYALRDRSTAQVIEDVTGLPDDELPPAMPVYVNVGKVAYKGDSIPHIIFPSPSTFEGFYTLT